eukprot:13928448-Ditylum_brightwellii.AAC.1
MYKVGSKYGPTWNKAQTFDRFLESGSYVCGNKLKGYVSNKYYVRQVLWCMDPIESEFYTPAEGSIGGCVLTKDICASCHEDQD